VRALKPRHVCKIGSPRAGSNGDESGKIVAISCEQGRTRRLLLHEDPRHRCEEFFAYDFLDHGETALECFHQARHNIVAVDGKASSRNCRIMRSDAVRNRPIGV
jgi:hypothetical protein